MRLARGVTGRDLVVKFPGIRKYVPLDDLEFFHRMCGCLALLGLIVGAFVWIIAMGSSCQNEGVAGTSVAQEKACLAMHPTITDAVKGGELLFRSVKHEGGSFLDPRDNVLMLRILVWPTWFFVIPLIYIAKRAAPKCLPVKLRQYWWEVCYYLHVFVAWFSIVVALYARFEVFWPTIFGWGLYFADKLREWWGHTHATEIIINVKAPDDASDSTVIYADHAGKPTAIKVVFRKPVGFEPHAGQILYVLIPSIDHVWHPFSLACATPDEHIELHIGIRGKVVDITEEGAHKMIDHLSDKYRGEPFGHTEGDIRVTYRILPESVQPKG